MIKGTFFKKMSLHSCCWWNWMQFSNVSLFRILSLQNLQFLCPILMENILKFYVFNFWSAPKSPSDSIYIATDILSCRKSGCPLHSNKENQNHRWASGLPDRFPDVLLSTMASIFINETNQKMIQQDQFQ